MKMSKEDFQFDVEYLILGALAVLFALLLFI